MVIIDGDIGVNKEANFSGVTLEEVIAQVKAQPEGDLHVKLRSNGGSEQTGTDIYEYFKSLKRHITIYAVGNVDSIATKILLAGDKRVGYKGITTGLIHTVGYPVKDAMLRQADLESLGIEAKKLNEDLAKFYSDVTGNTVQAFTPLMRDEKELDAAQLLSLGFLTEVQEKQVETRAVAYKSNSNMAEKAVTKEEFEKTTSSFQKSLDAILKKISFRATNLKLQSAAGEGETAKEVEFPDLGEGDNPTVGAKAMIDGEPASGEVVMPDGSTYVFADGELSEIKPEAEDQEMMALKEELEGLKTENEELKATNKKHEESQKELVESVKEIKAEFTNFKKTVGSNFSFKKEGGDPTGSDSNRNGDKPDGKKSRVTFGQE